MNTLAFIHKMLQDDLHKEGGYKIKTIVFQALPWDTFQECRVITDENIAYAALFEDGEKISAFAEITKENK